MNDKQPIYILPESTERTIGKDAQRNNILAAKLVSDAVKTTLGPKGMDKMLVDGVGDITVTNDGITILEKMEMEHPAAKMMVEISKTQEEEVGDGTTTAVMLAGKLLENAEKLLDMKIHPTIITKGYNLASEKAKEFLEESSISVNENKNEILKKIVTTAMTGKGAETVKERFSEIIVNAVNQIQEGNNIDLNNIKIIKDKSNGINDTRLIRGVVIDKERVSIDMPSKINNPKIILFSEALELKNPDETKISISNPNQLQEFMDREENMLKEMVYKIKAINANVIFCQKGIDDVVQYYLAKEGIYACRRVAKSDMENLARATGAKIMSKLNEISEEDLGKAEIVEEVKHGEDPMTYIQGCENPKALTILIHGGSNHVMDEMERALKDGLGDVASVIKDGRIVPGAGAIEVELSKKLKEFSNSLPGREQLAVQEFANALEFIPVTLAENAGLDPIDILTELKAKHDQGEKNAGINIFTNKIEDAFEKGIIEPAKIKKQAISSSSEVAVMILRIDDVLASKSSGKGGMPAGMPMGGYPGME
ncbi:thermosome subunit [Candidatus Pacearchaeota archaeon]|nr:thermosome subunit [Candidatus Pacearchaeota archaeon]|tara:strand:- start:589 stop:2205 length:1617 start_codon:yes stop_codon:yes gene_type:complete